MLRHNAHKTFSPKCVIDREDFTQEDNSMCRRLGSGWEGDGLERQVISCMQCHGGEGHCGCAPAGGATAFRDGGGCLLEVVPLPVALAPQASRQAGGSALNAVPCFLCHGWRALQCSSHKCRQTHNGKAHTSGYWNQRTVRPQA